MSAIPFTHYTRPDGRQKTLTIDRPEDVAEKARKIIDAGYRFECEILTDGTVSLTICDPEEGDVAIKLCTNGPAVPDAVDALIWSFHGHEQSAA